LYNQGIGTDLCRRITIVHDPVFGNQALAFTVDPAVDSTGNPSTGAVAMITSSISQCNLNNGTVNQCYELFPVTNMYVEVYYRINSTQYTQLPGGLPWDSFAWYSSTPPGNNGAMEIDFIEIWSGSNPYNVNGMVDWAGTPTYGDNQSSWTSPPPVDSSYHLIGSLNTANSTVTNIGACTYTDYGGTIANPVGIKCNGIHPKSSQGWNEEGYLVINNTAGTFSTPITTPFVGYIQWVRVWSCAGWSSTGAQPPAGPTTTNSCSSATVYNSGSAP
jgi:hypothetical protein